VERFIFSAPSKSRLAYAMLSMANTNRLHLYKEEGSAESAQLWREIAACRYWLRGAEQLAWGVPDTEGHDDFVVSLALCCRAVEELAPPPASVLIRARPDDESGW
jgi:hypothetical protein